MKFSSRLLFFFFACLLTSVCTVTMAEPPEVTELIVRFNYKQSDIARPQGLAETIGTGQASPDTLRRLGYPQSARPLITPSRNVAQSGTASSRPKRARDELEEYVILKYANRKALEMAKQALENDPDVQWVGENNSLSFQAAPSDPLFPQAGTDYDHQWGLHALNLPQAWDYAQGHAYIAILDTGIETENPDLQANFRPHLSYDFGHLDENVDELQANLQNPPTETNHDMVNFGVPPDMAGHGTHVAGILAATPNNGIGGSGVCWYCSLMVGKAAKITTTSFGNILNLNLDSAIEAIYWMSDAGAQVINMSFGGQYPAPPCTNPLNPLCLAINHAEEMDVVMVAAAGNERIQAIDYPAAEPRVIGVGAVDIEGQNPDWASNGPEKELVAPGVHVLSTFYNNVGYIPADYVDSYGFQPECTDAISGPQGYGPCSGTSMSTPHISGSAALLRSVNPLLTSDQIRELLIRHASQADNPDDVHGHGLPNMLESVRSTLGMVRGQTMINRLTPLFSLYSSNGQDYLYTTSPQMAMAAMYESLQPQPENGRVTWTPMGDSYVPGYPDFPRPANFWFERPKADVYIFTTHRNPFNPESELVPLYRLSYQGNYSGNNPSNVDHVYTTEQAGVEVFESSGYKLDGIEGYIFPDYEPQPPGSVKLYRKYNPTRDDHAIFPETMLAEMEAQGYTQNSGNEWIGYVYLNIDSDNDGLIDGFERIIGTDSDIPDSDYDGITDGVEINSYPYSDPMDTLPDSILLQRTGREITHNWHSLDISHSFLDAPVVLSQMQTTWGGDTASLRMRNLTNTALQVKVEEEGSRDSEVGHTTEVVGLLGLRAGEIRDTAGNIIGEAGFVMSNTANGGDWKTLSFSRNYTNPVVLMEMTTFNGGQPAHLRLKSVSTSSVKYQIEEWDYLDGGHATETLAYVVIEQGTQTLHDGKQLRVGTTSINQNWSNISFDDIGGLPLVFSQSQTYNGGQAVVTRHRNVKSNGFQLRLQEEEGNDGSHAMETVGYIAVQ